MPEILSVRKQVAGNRVEPEPPRRFLISPAAEVACPRSTLPIASTYCALRSTGKQPDMSFVADLLFEQPVEARFRKAYGTRAARAVAIRRERTAATLPGRAVACEWRSCSERTPPRRRRSRSTPSCQLDIPAPPGYRSAHTPSSSQVNAMRRRPIEISVPRSPKSPSQMGEALQIWREGGILLMDY